MPRLTTSQLPRTQLGLSGKAVPCTRGSVALGHHGVSKWLYSWKNGPPPPYHVAPCLVIIIMTIASPLVALEGTRGLFFCPMGVKIKPKQTNKKSLPYFRNKTITLFIMPLKLFGIKEIIWGTHKIFVLVFILK